MQKIVTNETFAIRDGERVTVVADRPESGRWLAVQARTVNMPDGGRSPVRHPDGAPVEQAGVVACQLNAEGLWQWVNLSPPSKETIGDLLFDAGASMDCWYYLILEDLRATRDLPIPTTPEAPR